MYWKDYILLPFYISQDVWVVKVALQLASWRLFAYERVAVKVVAFMSTQLTNRTINVCIRREKDKIGVLFASSIFFCKFFFESYEKCNQKNVNGPIHLYKWPVVCKSM